MGYILTHSAIKEKIQKITLFSDKSNKPNAKTYFGSSKEGLMFM